MAQPLTCDFCEGAEVAVILIHRVDDGSVTGVGPNCMDAFGRAMAGIPQDAVMVSPEKKPRKATAVKKVAAHAVTPAVAAALDAAQPEASTGPDDDEDGDDDEIEPVTPNLALLESLPDEGAEGTG